MSYENISTGKLDKDTREICRKGKTVSNNSKFSKTQYILEMAFAVWHFPGFNTPEKLLIAHWGHLKMPKNGT